MILRKSLALCTLRCMRIETLCLFENLPSYMNGFSHWIALYIVINQSINQWTWSICFVESNDCSEATVPLEDTETACMLVTALSVDKEVRVNLCLVFNDRNVIFRDDCTGKIWCMASSMTCAGSKRVGEQDLGGKRIRTARRDTIGRS